MQEVINVLKQYIVQGFYIFPCNFYTKSPLTLHGFKDASNNFEIINPQFYKEDLLIGCPTGKVNGIVIIDVDINKKLPNGNIDFRTVEELKEEVESSYGELPETFTVESPSGGRHYWYILPEHCTKKISSRSRFLCNFLSIDIKGDGGYVIAPDEINYFVYDDIDSLGLENIKKRCAILPEWIINYEKGPNSQEKNNNNQVPANILPPEEVAAIRSALNYIEAESYDSWYRIGMALKSTNSLTAKGLFHDWSSKSEKYDALQTEKKWKEVTPRDITIASLFHEAKKAGWVSPFKKEIIPVVQPEVIKPEEKKTTNIEKHKKKPFPEELLNPGGLVGDIMEYVIEKSIMPQPVFALSASLCAVGALAGRKVQTETGIRTNIYACNIGASGCGKDAPREAIKGLFYEAGCSNLASVESLASDSAIITELHKVGCESQVFLLDEIGRFIETTKKGPAHLSNVVTVLLSLYSSAKQVFSGKSYADNDKKKTIVQPNLCILGTTVPETMYKGLSYENVTDGFLSRMLLFETDNNRPRKKISENFLRKPKTVLIEKIKKLLHKHTKVHLEGNLDQFSIPDPQIAYKTEEAQSLLDRFDDYLYDFREKLEKENKIDAMYNRTSQTAEQIALILAIGNDVDNPTITAKEMSYGIALAKYLADHLQFIVENHMAKNELEHEVKRIFNIIKKDEQVSLAEISKHSQNLTGHARADILETLKASGQIEESFIGEGIFARKIYKAL